VVRVLRLSAVIRAVAAATAPVIAQLRPHKTPLLQEVQEGQQGLDVWVVVELLISPVMLRRQASTLNNKPSLHSSTRRLPYHYQTIQPASPRSPMTTSSPQSLSLVVRRRSQQRGSRQWLEVRQLSAQIRR